ncbi:hypothetical protein 13VV501A_gene0004 [Vibrio phage 13VV501A]|nr:hypothetical protein 13VV501A_gene0004 [Vibrio phage 13VV501A]
MEPYKIECIDVQHAIIAALRIQGMGFRTVRLGKAVLTDAPMVGNVPQVVMQAMAITSSLNDFDKGA